MSKMILRFLMVLAITSTGVFINGCTSTPPQTPRYTKYNIHVKSDMSRRAKHVLDRACYSNWTASDYFLPVNTKVLIGRYNRGFSLLDVDNNRRILFEYNRVNMKMSTKAYIELITSTTPVDLHHLSELDRRGIREGKALPGMSKEGVLRALGYPAKHKTPSLDEDNWVYWTNRFRQMNVTFGGTGTVTNVR